MTMKRLIVVIMILSMVLGQVTFADKFLEYDSVELTDGMSNQTEAYTTVGMTLAGNDVITDVPSILYDVEGNYRTLVPMSFIAKGMGVSVSWDNATKTASFEADGNKVSLQADNPFAEVNGIGIQLPNAVPPKLMGYRGDFRILVPIRFVAEQLGLEVGWDGDARTVILNYPRQEMTSIRLEESGQFQEIRVKTSGEVKTTSYFLAGSDVGSRDRIIIDLENTAFEVPEYKLEGGKETIHLLYGDIKYISAYPNEDKTRVEIELERRRGYDAFYDEDAGELVIRFINSVRDIRTEKIYTADTVIINTGEEPAYNVIRLKDKVIVDVMNSLMKMNEGQYGIEEVHQGGISQIAYSQFDPSGEYDPTDVISRVVVNLEEDTSVEDVYIEHIDNEIYVYVSGAPLNGFDYAKNSLDAASLQVNLLEKSTFRTKEDKASGLYWVYLPKSAIELSEMDVMIDDSIVDRMVIDTDSDDDEYIVKLDLADGTRVIKPSGETAAWNVALAFVNDDLKNSKYRNTLVVIDPGHGGRDVGAVGSYSVESELALNASKRLKKELEGLGFKTYLIRDTDMKVQLQQRSRIANELGADLFISVHINAAENPKARGVEVLYAPESTGEKKRLARVLQDQLLAFLGSVDRGIVERPNLHVCRATNMPSVIAELGFITNKEEEDRMNTPEFMISAAKALAKGIQLFFDK